MVRIFSSLAIVATLLLLTAMVFGLSVGFEIGAYNGIYAQRLEAQQRLTKQQTAGQNDLAEETQLEIEGLDSQFLTVVRRASLHMLVGILAAIVAILVSSISVTYFIGTSRWCKEVIDTYGLDSALSAESRRLKRKSFPWALLGIISVILIVSFGGASDPSTGMKSTAEWALPHFVVALGGTTAIVFSYLKQASFIRQNSDLVEKILGEVHRIRIERGLDVES